MNSSTFCTWHNRLSWCGMCRKLQQSEQDEQNCIAITLTQNKIPTKLKSSLQWRHNEHNDVSNHQPHDCLLNGLFRHKWKKTSKLRVTGLCEGNSPVTGEFPAHWANNTENVPIWWPHHVIKSNHEWKWPVTWQKLGYEWSLLDLSS